MRASRMMNLRWALILTVCVLKPSSLFSAQGSGGPRYTTNAADSRACSRQLNIIYGAITQYRQDHDGEYPEQLHALVPNYIHDGKVLICPYALKRGGLQE